MNRMKRNPLRCRRPFRLLFMVLLMMFLMSFASFARMKQVWFITDAQGNPLTEQDLRDHRIVIALGWDFNHDAGDDYDSYSGYYETRFYSEGYKNAGGSTKIYTLPDNDPKNNYVSQVMFQQIWREKIRYSAVTKAWGLDSSKYYTYIGLTAGDDYHPLEPHKLLWVEVDGSRTYYSTSTYYKDAVHDGNSNGYIWYRSNAAAVAVPIGVVSTKQSLKVKWQQADGTYKTTTELDKVEKKQGEIVTWNYAGSNVYKSATYSYTAGTVDHTGEVTVERKKYKAVFDPAVSAGDGTVTQDKTSIQVLAEGKLGTLPTASRTGYSFDGWYTQKDGGSRITASTSIGTSDKTFYAHWSDRAYSITYDYAGGRVYGSNPVSYRVSDPTLYIKNPVKEGYSFAGYTLSGEGASSVYRLLGVSGRVLDLSIPQGSSGNLKITANWTSAEYTVRYDANGGSGTMPAEKAAAGTAVRLRSCGFARDGYHFVQWNTRADGFGTYYGETETVVLDRNLVLYAIWEPDGSGASPEDPGPRDIGYHGSTEERVNAVSIRTDAWRAGNTLTLHLGG